MLEDVDDVVLSRVRIAFSGDTGFEVVAAWDEAGVCGEFGDLAVLGCVPRASEMLLAFLSGGPTNREGAGSRWAGMPAVECFEGLGFSADILSGR